MENLNEVFDKSNIPQAGFFKFKVPGDKVVGFYVGHTDHPEKDGFKPQRVYDLKQRDGTIVKVGIALARDYVIGRASTAKLGDLLGFEFVKEIPPKTPGLHPAKSIEVYVKHIDVKDKIQPTDSAL